MVKVRPIAIDYNIKHPRVREGVLLIGLVFIFS